MKMLKKLIKNNNFLSLLGNTTAAGLGFLSFALLARMLSKDDFGNLMIFITLCTFFDLLRTGFLQTPLIRFSSVNDENEKKVVIGSSWAFGLAITFVIGLLGLIIYFLFGKYITSIGFLHFLKLMWILSLSTLPFNFAIWNLQSELRFNKIIFIRWINLGSFVIMLLTNVLYLNKGIDFVIYAFIASNVLASTVCLLSKWTKISFVKYWSSKMMKQLLGFGKFSMSTMIGSNLLRSSDTFMIGALMNPAAVAIYSIPAKLFEVIEIPLRSFVATALPNLSRLYNENEKERLTNLFEKYSGIITILMIPFAIGCIVLADFLVILLGGEQYADSANILRIFAIFAVLMPLDRYTGVTLDVVNKPIKNFHKILIMLGVKVAGNFFVINLFGEVWMVAVSSIFTFATGVIIGIYFLKKSLSFSIRRLLMRGYTESKLFALKGINRPNVTGN